MNAIPKERIHVPSLVTGVVLVAAFFSLSQTSTGFDIAFIPPWDRSTAGELYFWLAACFFLYPGAALVGWALAEPIARVWSTVRDKLVEASPRDRTISLVLLGVFAFAIARAGQGAVFFGFPFTDDEWAARFGGQVLATGHFLAPRPPLPDAAPSLFCYARDGMWTSIDFLGAQLVWALSELTHSGALAFHVFAAFAACGVAVACARAWGIVWGMVGAVLVFASPMLFTLSMTSHGHVVSRGAIALAAGLLLFARDVGLARGVLAGLCIGFAAITRPFETFGLLAPVSAYLVHRARAEPTLRKMLLGVALGVSVPLVVMAVQHLAVTGSLSFPREAPNEIEAPFRSGGPFEIERWWRRFGTNLSYNGLTLAIWFLGPAGLVLAVIGALRGTTERMLGVGVLLTLGMALLHDDRGLHVVGPIHYSEAGIVLAILATGGVERVYSFAAERRRRMAGATVAYLAIGCSVFTAMHAMALTEQSMIHRETYALLDEVDRTPAVLLAPQYALVWHADIFHELRGSFVFEWRRPRPDQSEEVLVLHDSLEARAQVREAYPDRAPFVLVVTPSGNRRIVPLDEIEAEASGASSPE